MAAESKSSPLVWVSHVYAMNPANIAMVFHGVHGELEVTLVSGTKAVLNERDLTDEGRFLLIPSGSAPHVANSRNANQVLAERES
jgi:hypothetical protein